MEVVDAEIGGGFKVDGCHIEGINMNNLHVAGSLSLSGTRLSSRGRYALSADGLVVGTDFFCARGFRTVGEVRLLGARIGGQFVLSGAQLSNLGGCALSADGLVVEGGVVCQDGFQAEGEVWLPSARIAGQFNLSGARLSNPGGCALSADGLVVEGSVVCQDGFQAEGEVRLPGARIAGQLNLNGARLSNPGGCALNADRLVVEGSVVCQDGFQAEGEVRLPGARIAGQLNLSGARLSNPGGCALSADGLMVEDSMFCQDGFQAEGEIWLPGARVTGQLGFNGAHLSNSNGIALTCHEAQIGSLWLKGGLSVNGRVNLSRARIGTIFDSAECWPSSLTLNELVYDDLEPDLPARQRLRWIRCSEEDYRAQPYEQLATYYRRQGHDEEARKVLLAKQRHHRASRPWYARIFGYLLDWIVGYGYRPGRAAAWMLIFLVAGSLFFTYHRPSPIKLGEHPPFQPVLYAADLLLPIVNLGQEGAFKHQGLAQVVAAVMVLLGWIFATAVIAGVTRVLSRS
ncbi:hypothetical protein [Planobispora rosea]|uniref:hypothetical protein n=1 Tax=Planobispora rosea TaxID=35762 RepID=UPI00114D37ED|nr:hypothetical protein [Planobispora rosea]